jgi:hypothetical protein
MHMSFWGLSCKCKWSHIDVVRMLLVLQDPIWNFFFFFQNLCRFDTSSTDIVIIKKDHRSGEACKLCFLLWLNTLQNHIAATCDGFFGDVSVIISTPFISFTFYYRSCSCNLKMYHYRISHSNPESFSEAFWRFNEEMTTAVVND